MYTKREGKIKTQTLKFGAKGAMLLVWIAKWHDHAFLMAYAHKGGALL